MNPINRREFLGTAAVGAAALGTSLDLRAATEGPNLRIGLIGCGGYGWTDLRRALEAGGVEVIALCDVDTAQMDRVAGEVATRQAAPPARFKHYQELLRTPGLQAVIIATPPHWHALPFIAACERGLDIYCEKPMAYDVRESRAMVDAAKRTGRVVQIGFQRRNSSVFQQARQFIRSGQAGRIVCVDAQIHWPIRLGDPAPKDPPSTLDWDLWCGPGPLIPYSEQVGHRHWRYEKTSGNGHLVDWGIHLVDVTRWILGEDAPRRITAAGGLHALKGRITTPDVLTVHFEFESCPLTWSHRIWGAAEPNAGTKYSTIFFGEKATVLIKEDGWAVYPREGNGEPVVHEVPDNPQLEHMKDFLVAVRTRQMPACLPEDAHYSTAAVNLAMIAYEIRQPLLWDGRNEEVLDNPAAAALLRREYRAPWVHPGRR